MLLEKSCRCGAAKKRFKMDIGDFYIGDCCEAAGYDALGNLKSESISEAKQDVSKLQAFFGVKSPEAMILPKGGRGKLMDMTVPALKELAVSKGLQLSEDMNKKQIVAELLK